ncbi:MAG TPA: ATP-binding cassette domain-containing protein [Chondromyces sp.]|nr:ATP-binding cassette domain-containing protein [Chondromyces sp.]
MSGPLLEMEGVSYQYPDGTAALDDVSLKIEQGKKIVLLGNNGAGKSTLFLHFNAILRPASGSIRFLGEKLRYKQREVRKLRQRVGIVFQNPDTQLFSTSVYEDIKYGPANLGWPAHEVEMAVEEAMIRTEVDSLKDRPPHLLSLGQKKRVTIAGILAMKPDLLILDEPTAGMDSYYSKKIMGILDSVMNPERSIVLSTHDVNLAYEWADQILVMKNGRLMAKGNPDVIFFNEELCRECHLEKPWIVEMYEKIRQKGVSSQAGIPGSRAEFMEWLEQVL